MLIRSSSTHLFRFRRLSNVEKVDLRKLTTTQLWKEPKGQDTGINVYNCVARKCVPLILRNPNFASWYTCGPTVYDAGHIGHASCYVKLDIIQRILRDYFHINVVTAMNITDIDDKIITKSNNSGAQQWHEIARTYETEFWDDLKKLNVKEPDIKIRVTENIPLIIKFIENILKKDLAYIGKDNSVYFKVDSYPNYGKLQHLNLESSQHDDEVKNSQNDFALWKAKKLGEPSWSSPWGEGRPGWHIECSALASKLFGDVIDFHAGGIDLKFPHHENEEAQSCAHHNTTQWVNYWLHTGHLNLKGQTEKMSKSLKNTISIEELLSNYSSDDFRMACLLSNYRNSMEFGDEMMQSAKSTLQKFIAFNSDCQAYLRGMKNPLNIDLNKISESIKRIDHLVSSSLKDDFNTSKCIGHLSELVSVVSKEINKPETTDIISARPVDIVGAAMQFVEKIFRIFGLKLQPFHMEEMLVDSNELVDEIVTIRHIIRSEAIITKNMELLKLCDNIRNNLKSKGIEIKDHKKGSTWNFFVNKLKE